MGGVGSGTNQQSEKNAMWKGGISPSRARRYKKDLCERCHMNTERLCVHHINENPSDNRPENIETLCRSCHVKVHGFNKRRSLTSPYPGVTWVKRDRKWQAQCKFGGRDGYNHYLGYFTTPEAARDAVIRFREENMNKAKRYAAYATLHANNVHMAVDLHELWRVTHTEKDGLTDKEYAYLSKQYEELEQTLLKISKATRHVKKGL